MVWNKRINPGELRESVIVQSKVESVDENGYEEFIYEDLYTLRCKINTIKSKEYIGASTDKSEVTLKLICRRRQIDHKMIVVYNSMRFNIENIHIVDSNFLELTIKTEY